MAQPPMRHAALELGRRLKEAGVLDQIEDILHLRMEELEGLGEPWPPLMESRDRAIGMVK